MSTLIQGNNGFIFTSGLRFGLVKQLENNLFSSSFDDVDVKDIPEPLPRDVNEAPQPPKTEELAILAGCVSTCGKYLALVDDHKQLTIWLWDNLSLVKQVNLVRRANTVIFDNALSVLVADKSGDVFKYSVLGGAEVDGKCILGHLSMLLDILTSPCGKFVVTCDRDEKIRVSHYPNSYNVHNFCLGHTDFVSAIVLAPHDPRILVSGSGDGTIRSWDYLNGREIDQVLCTDHSGTAVENFPGKNPNPDELRVQRNPNPAVVAVKAGQIANGSSVLAVAIESLENGILLYECKAEGNLSLWKKLSLSGKLCGVSFGSNSKLLTMQNDTNENFVLFDLKHDKTTCHSAKSDFVKGAIMCPSLARQADDLHKRWFDNVKDYMDRKRERIENGGLKKKAAKVDR